jgi:GTP-binding protein Era
VSAKTGDGIDELRDDLISLLPEGPLYYADGEVTDMPLEARIAELVREQALRLLKEEVPHAITADVVEIDDRRVHVRIYTETESQKQILIGKGGSMVREIGRWARPGIEELLGHAIFLELQVKASPKWRRNETMLERLGL